MIKSVLIYDRNLSVLCHFISFQFARHLPMASLLRRGLSQMVRQYKPNLITLTSKNSPVLYLSLRKVASSGKKDSSTAVSISEKTPYEIELERLKKEEPGQTYYGYFKDEPYLDKMLYHGIWLVVYSFSFLFALPLLFYIPMVRGNDKEWKAREAQSWIAKRRANGEPLISRDFAPAELMEGMVPPPGDWEREWLMQQSSVRPTFSKVYNHDYTY